jgi:hypothetical protein
MKEKNSRKGRSRETREVWPLLTVETEVGTQRVQMKEVLRWLVRWACRYKRFLFCPLAALVGPVQNILNKPL